MSGSCGGMRVHAPMRGDILSLPGALWHSLHDALLYSAYLAEVQFLPNGEVLQQAWAPTLASMGREAAAVLEKGQGTV